MIKLGLILAIVAITMTDRCFGMHVSEIKQNLVKLFSVNPEDALTLEQARNVVIEVCNMRDEALRSKYSIDDSTYDDVCDLYAENMEHVCDTSNIEELMKVESRFHDKPNVMLVLQRPRNELMRKCHKMFMERLGPDTFSNENPETWLALSKVVHSAEPTFVHSVTNGQQLFSALRHAVSQTLKSLGFVKLFDVLTAEGNVIRFKDNLCKTKSFKMSHMLFGEYVAFDKDKSFLKGLSGEQEDTLIRSLVCNWLDRLEEYAVWDSYIASQRTISELNANVFGPDSQSLTAEEVHMSLRVISRYHEVSDETQSQELDDMKLNASNLLIPIDYPQCTSDELIRINGLISLKGMVRNIMVYHKLYVPLYLEFCEGQMLKDLEVELETSSIMEHVLNKVLQMEVVDIDEIGVSDVSVEVGLVSAAKLIENIKMDNKFTMKSRILSKIENMRTKLIQECPQIAAISLETKSKFVDILNSLENSIRHKIWNLLSKNLQKVILANDVCTLIQTIKPEQVLELKDEIPNPK